MVGIHPSICTHGSFFVFVLGSFIRLWLVDGLGPGGLDSWDPLLKNDCYLGPLESRTTNLPFLLIAGGGINFFFPPWWSRTVEFSAEACQQRCQVLDDCAHFTFWPDGGCLLTAEISYPKAIFLNASFPTPFFFGENKITPGQN